MVQRLQNFYEEKIVPQLMDQFAYKNKHQVPKLDKIVINRGLGDASQNAKLLESCSKELSMIKVNMGLLQDLKKQLQVLNFDKKCLLVLL